MVEGGVDHAIAGRRAASQAFQILDIATMGLGAHGREPSGTRVRAREAEDLVAVRDQFGDDLRADEAGRSSKENTHPEFSIADAILFFLSCYPVKVVTFSYYND
ncbi:hypothetical protein K32_25950 [Kaistia sp. 32K]|nr:hypothetical protein K32_25950 [Kaistia sp. 32K]